MWSVLLLSLVPCVVLAEGDFFCPDHWHKSPRSRTCVKAFDQEKKTWQNARYECRRQGGDLVKVVNRCMNDFLKTINLLNRAVGNRTFVHKRYWIGLTDTETEGTYLWADGTVPSYSNWYTTPFTVQFEAEKDCACIKESSGNWYWSDCNETKYFFCEKPLAFCPPGWGHPHYESCLKLYSTEESWENASTACRNVGAELLTIGNIVTNNLAQEQNASTSIPTYWIGLNDKQTNGTWVWSNGNRQVTFHNWHPQFPAYPLSTGEEGNCGYINKANGRWFNERCSVQNPYICQKPAYFCPLGWIESSQGMTCIKEYIKTKSWQNASTACEAEGANLVKVVNQEMDEYIANFRAYFFSRRYWTGLNDLRVNGTWAWLNETEQATYINWEAGNPRAGEHCAVIHLNQGEIQTIRCNILFPYICEQPAVTCPFDWDRNTLSGSCINHFKVKKSWHNARTHCQTHEADLVKIMDKGMNDFIYGESFTPTSDFWWIGLNDLQTEGEYKWLDGSGVASYQNFRPSHNVSAYDCIVMKRNDKTWKPESCNYERTFICERFD